ncbi:MAG: hypothetical protein V3U27_20075, partial [Candidatus Tectomicrobia bacterium]
ASKRSRAAPGKRQCSTLPIFSILFLSYFYRAARSNRVGGTISLSIQSLSNLEVRPKKGLFFSLLAT